MILLVESCEGQLNTQQLCMWRRQLLTASGKQQELLFELYGPAIHYLQQEK